MNVQTIGDEVYADGWLVALLATDTGCASAIDLFRDWLEHATVADDRPDEPEPTPPEQGADSYEAALQDVATSITPFIRGGLVRVSDLHRILAQLKEETP